MVLVDYPIIRRESIKYHVRKTIINIIHSNIDVHRIRIIDEFPGDVGIFFTSFNIIVQTLHL